MSSALATAMNTLGYLSAPLSWFERAERRGGPVFRAETLPYGRETFVADPEIARAVLASRLMLGGRANVAIRHVVGEESVSSLDGARHAERRRLLVPVLARGRVAASAERSHDRALRALVRQPMGVAVPLGPMLRGIVMETMLEAVFGAPRTAVVRAELGQAFAQLVDRGAVPFAQLGLLPALRWDWPLSPWRRFVKALGDVDARIHREIANANANANAGMLGALVETGLGDRALRDEVFTLLGAGYETTSTSLAWALESMLLGPETASAVAGDERRVDAAIHESLRFRPTLPTVRRVAEAPFDAGGVRIEAGESVVLAIHLLHRKGAFFAFGGGPRTCPGMGMALEHMRGVLMALAPRLSLVRPRPSRPIFRGATIAPARAIMVQRSA